MTAKKHPKLWIVLADGAHARVVSPAIGRHQFTTTLAFDSTTAHLRAKDLGTDRPGRTFESTGGLRHAITPRQDPHQAAKHDFVVEVAKQINEQAASGVFGRLVVVAPAHALHDLRDALTPHTQAMVVGSLTKDLTKVPDHELSDHLSEWWQAPSDETA